MCKVYGRSDKPMLRYYLRDKGVWQDNINSHLFKYIGCKDVNWIKMAQNRIGMFFVCRYCTFLRQLKRGVRYAVGCCRLVKKELTSCVW
jgi:hypothetical protein